MDAFTNTPNTLTPMRHVFAWVLLLCASASFGQNTYRRLFATDPYNSNGYFIVDEAKRQQLGATQIVVRISVNTRQPNGGSVRTVVETLTITAQKHYAHADQALLAGYGPDENVLYHATAYNANGDVVDDFDSTNGELPLPEICRTTCNAPAYAWSLVASSNQAYTVINMVDATSNGAYEYFYVKAVDWGAFTDQFTPQDFGLSLSYWNLYPSEVVPFNLEVQDLQPIGPGFRDYQGFSISQYTGYCYGIRKDRGPWRSLFAYTDHLVGGAGSWCVDEEVLRAGYTGDDNVQFQLSQQGLPALACQGLYSTGGGTSWGSGSANLCTEISYSDGTGDLDVVGWVMETVECPNVTSIGGTPSLSSVSSIIINHWYPATVRPVVTISVPDEDDPRLVPVEKTLLEPGLYEFTIVFDNGKQLRQFCDFDEQVKISANFASFTEVNIYPVPVTGTSFSVDFDLLVPMDIELTVVNNQGTPYYSKFVPFELPGKNKHVVEMTYSWPTGLYHCIIQYPDGSSDAISISVQ
jgi:hypothetical protein